MSFENLDAADECRACGHSRRRHDEFLWNCDRDDCTCVQFEEEEPDE